MAKTLKKKLPKNFSHLLKTGNLAKLRAVFEECEIDARGDFNATAFLMPDCPDEFARWLVEQGADIRAVDKFHRSALQSRLYSRNSSIKVLIELGCDIHEEYPFGTPLHIAAERTNLEAIRLLLKAGAKIEARNNWKDTPLEHALRTCQNADIEEMVPTAKLLLNAGAKPTDKTREFVEKIGQQFEEFRDDFNPDYLPQTDAALKKLYKLFDATPAPRRVKYDGHSPIVAKAKTWQKAHQELCDLLVPGSGAAETVQGEVIRISGRISGELYRNGGGNWDREFRQMANNYLKLVASGNPVNDDQLAACRQLSAKLPDLDNADLLAEMAVAWVKLNPQPVRLGKVNYKR